LKLLLTSVGIKNPSIHDTLAELLGKPTAECDALCIPTALYGHPMAGPRQAWRCISGQEPGTPTVGLGWKSMEVLQLTALPSLDAERAALPPVTRSIWPPLPKTFSTPPA
jgi:dipeptidase E